MEIPILKKGKELKAIINKTTKNNYRAYIHKDGKRETNKEYLSKLDLAYSGYLINVISYSKYKRSKKERKANQNKNHIENSTWHYFSKLIIFNNEVYEVILDIIEKDNKLIIYNVKLKEATSSFSLKDVRARD